MPTRHTFLAIHGHELQTFLAMLVFIVLISKYTGAIRII